ncbi:MAG: 50S ribosomal protein L10 [Bacteroidota bacterium]
MALTKEQKREAVAAIAEDLESVNTIYLTDYAGLTVEQANTLRGEFFKADVRYKVLKNTLLKRAMDDAEVDYSGLYEYLSGPTAVAFTNDPATPGKVIKKFLEGDAELPKLKGAYVDGAFFGSDALDQLAALKSKDELIGDILGLLMAPATNIVGGLQAQGSNLVGALKTIAEKEEG